MCTHVSAKAASKHACSAAELLELEWELAGPSAATYIAIATIICRKQMLKVSQLASLLATQRVVSRQSSAIVLHLCAIACLICIQASACMFTAAQMHTQNACMFMQIAQRLAAQDWAASNSPIGPTHRQPSYQGKPETLLNTRPAGRLGLILCEKHQA